MAPASRLAAVPGCLAGTRCRAPAPRAARVAASLVREGAAAGVLRSPQMSSGLLVFVLFFSGILFWRKCLIIAVRNEI